MFCLKCYFQNTVTADFCEACGEPLKPGEKCDQPPAHPRAIERHPAYERDWRQL